MVWSWLGNSCIHILSIKFRDSVKIQGLKVRFKRKGRLRQIYYEFQFIVNINIIIHFNFKTNVIYFYCEKPDMGV